MIARDIYAFYPLLIKYVDLQRNLWIRHNVAESEELYNHVGEVFNTMNISLVGMLVSACIHHLKRVETRNLFGPFHPSLESEAVDFG